MVTATFLNCAKAGKTQLWSTWSSSAREESSIWTNRPNLDLYFTYTISHTIPFLYYMDINDIVTTVNTQFSLLHTSSLHIKFTLLSNNKFYLFNAICAMQLSYYLVLLQLPTTWTSSTQLSHHHLNGWELSLTVHVSNYYYKTIIVAY